MRMYFSILTGVENGQFYSSKTGNTRVRNDDFES